MRTEVLQFYSFDKIAEFIGGSKGYVTGKKSEEETGILKHLIP